MNDLRENIKKSSEFGNSRTIRNAYCQRMDIIFNSSLSYSTIFELSINKIYISAMVETDYLVI